MKETIFKINPFCGACDRDLPMPEAGFVEEERVYPHFHVGDDGKPMIVFHVGLDEQHCGCCDDDEGEAA